MSFDHCITFKYEFLGLGNCIITGEICFCIVSSNSMKPIALKHSSVDFICICKIRIKHIDEQSNGSHSSLTFIPELNFLEAKSLSSL